MATLYAQTLFESHEVKGEMFNLEAIWTSLSLETQIFIAAIALTTIWFHINFTPSVVANGPTILTTTGIFATFLGIALGLAHFDAANIQASVPALLSGLKTAFWASVVGVFSALTIKLREQAFGVPHKGASLSPNDVNAADIHKQLIEIQRGLVGSEDGSLISQLKLSRQDTNDRLDELKKAQIEALSKLSDMGSRALVEALRNVIQDFNQKISEQFGENFKELNSAVGKLLVWQQQYQGYVESSSDKLNTIIGLTQKATADYSRIVQEASTFSQSAQDLNVLIKTLNENKEHLISVSQSLAQLLREASGSLPSVEKKVIGLTETLADTMSRHQRTVGETLTHNSELTRSSLEEVTKGLSRITAATEQQVKDLESKLGEVLEECLSSLGSQLTTLSERFVEDYTPLTTRLRQLVHMTPAE